MGRSSLAWLWLKPRMLACAPTRTWSPMITVPRTTANGLIVQLDSGRDLIRHIGLGRDIAVVTQRDLVGHETGLWRNEAARSAAQAALRGPLRLEGHLLRARASAQASPQNSQGQQSKRVACTAARGIRCHTLTRGRGALALDPAQEGHRRGLAQAAVAQRARALLGFDDHGGVGQFVRDCRPRIEVFPHRALQVRQIVPAREQLPIQVAAHACRPARCAPPAGPAACPARPSGSAVRRSAPNSDAAPCAAGSLAGWSRGLPAALEHHAVAALLEIVAIQVRADQAAIQRQLPHVGILARDPAAGKS